MSIIGNLSTLQKFHNIANCGCCMMMTLLKVKCGPLYTPLVIVVCC
eukprot:UN02238